MMRCSDGETRRSKVESVDELAESELAREEEGDKEKVATYGDPKVPQSFWI